MAVTPEDIPKLAAERIHRDLNPRCHSHLHDGGVIRHGLFRYHEYRCTICGTTVGKVMNRA